LKIAFLFFAPQDEVWQRKTQSSVQSVRVKLYRIGEGIKNPPKVLQVGMPVSTDEHVSDTRILYITICKSGQNYILFGKYKQIWRLQKNSMTLLNQMIITLGLVLVVK